MLDFLILSLVKFSLFESMLGIFIALMLFFITIKSWSSKTKIFKSFIYHGEQRVHLGEVPRLGGLVIYFCLVFFTFILNYESEKIILICMIPMVTVILAEDITHNVDYKIRLISLFLSSILLIIFGNTSLPKVEGIFIISSFFENRMFSFIFFTFCLLALANGFNFIDGMNGLLSFYIIGALVSCAQLCYITNDFLLLKPIIIYFVLIILFIIFNFPMGKIFLGDLGAYLMALLLGIWVINFFGKYDYISSWNAVLIFFYPICEVTYSIIRKLAQKKSPFLPDRNHLHLKIFDILNTSLNKPRLCNNLTTIFIAIFWLSPPLIMLWVFDKQILIISSFLIMAIIYIIVNNVIPSYDYIKKSKN